MELLPHLRRLAQETISNYVKKLNHVSTLRHRGSQHQKYMATRLPPGMAPDSAGETKPITAAQKKNQARAAARRAKKAAERAAAAASSASEDGVCEVSTALEGMKVYGGAKAGEATDGGQEVEPADTAKKV